MRKSNKNRRMCIMSRWMSWTWRGRKRPSWRQRPRRRSRNWGRQKLNWNSWQKMRQKLNCRSRRRNRRLFVWLTIRKIIIVLTTARVMNPKIYPWHPRRLYKSNQLLANSQSGRAWPTKKARWGNLRSSKSVKLKLWVEGSPRLRCTPVLNDFDMKNFPFGKMKE